MMFSTPVFLPPPTLPVPPPTPAERLRTVARRESWNDDCASWPKEARRLLDEDDVSSLVDYYAAKSRSRPFDLHVQVRHAEALLVSDRPGDALDLLADCHRRAPDFARCRGLLVDALDQLGRDPLSWAWHEPPTLLELDRNLLDRCLGFLRARRCSWAADDLYRFWAARHDRLRFTPAALLRELDLDPRFELDEMDPGRLDPSTTWIRPAGQERERRWFGEIEPAGAPILDPAP